MQSRTKKEMLFDLRMKQMIKNGKNIFDGFLDDDIPDYDNKRVILSLKDYVKRVNNGELSENFVTFLSERGEEVFMARKSDVAKNTYELDGVESWLFNFQDLELFEKD